MVSRQRLPGRSRAAATSTPPWANRYSGGATGRDPWLLMPDAGGAAGVARLLVPSGMDVVVGGISRLLFSAKGTRQAGVHCQHFRRECAGQAQQWAGFKAIHLQRVDELIRGPRGWAPACFSGRP